MDRILLMDNLLETLQSLDKDLSMRGKVFIAEAAMKQQPQIDLKVEHFFSLGVYARQLYIPKGVILVGKIHKFPQLNILSQGDISVLVDEEIKRIKAPFTVASPSGVKRIAYAHEDCIWITIHGTDETNLETIEKTFIAQDENEYLEFCGQQRLLKAN